MAKKDLLKELSLSEEEADRKVAELLDPEEETGLAKMYEDSLKDFKPDTILKGRILDIVGQDVLIDIGYKSEGVVPLQEFNNPSEIKLNDEIEVLLEQVEDHAAAGPGDLPQGRVDLRRAIAIASAVGFAGHARRMHPGEQRLGARGVPQH